MDIERNILVNFTTNEIPFFATDPNDTNVNDLIIYRKSVRHC